MGLDELIDLERALILLIHPGSSLKFNRRSHCWIRIDPNSPDLTEVMPQWARSNDAAFTLMQTEKCYPVAIIGGVSVEDVFCERRLVFEYFGDYGGDRDLATRVTLVKGCIERRKLRNTAKEKRK